MAKYTMCRSDVAGKVSVIYTLSHPETGEVRYVGVTSQKTTKRLQDHIKDARRHRRSWTHKWILSLLDAGVAPDMAVIETVPGGGDRAGAERRWIAHYRAAGARLTNLTDGGEGAFGYQMTPEARAYISAHRKAYGITPETRAKMLEGRKLVFATPEFRAKLSETRKRTAVFGRKHSPEVRAKMAAKQKAMFKANPSPNVGKKGAAHPLARAVIVDGVEYPTQVAAAKALGISQSGVFARIKRGRAFYAD